MKDKLYLLIDGNTTLRPVAYCQYMEGYLSDGLVDTHDCYMKKCQGFKRLA